MGHRVSVTLLLGLAVPGCVAAARPIAHTRFIPGGDVVTAMDADVYRLVRLENSRTEKTATGRLHVEVDLRSVVQFDTPIELRTVFKDTADFPLADDTTGWQVVIVPALGTYVHQATSLSPKAGGFTVEVRVPR